MEFTRYCVFNFFYFFYQNININIDMDKYIVIKFYHKIMIDSLIIINDVLSDFAILKIA